MLFLFSGSRMQQGQVPTSMVPMKPKLATSAYPQQSLPPSVKSYPPQQQQQHGGQYNRHQQQHGDAYYRYEHILQMSKIQNLQ